MCTTFDPIAVYWTESQTLPVSATITYIINIHTESREVNKMNATLMLKSVPK